MKTGEKRDYIWSYVGTLFNIGINILMLPFVLAYLADNELGMWYVFQSLNALVALLDFGFNATVARNINYAWNVRATSSPKARRMEVAPGRSTPHFSIE